MDFARLERLCAADFAHTWGHNYAVSQSARLQGTLSFARFAAHLQSMLPHLESWDNEVTDVTVDEARRRVVLRVSFWMKVQGEESVENDLVWAVEVDEVGKVRRSEEFVDAVAAGRLKELMMKGAQTQGGGG
jgi:ketosteroid isomerase-like protein